MTNLEGTVALVTGASSGIGEATARALAAQGAKVARRRPPQGPARRARAARSAASRSRPTSPTASRRPPPSSARRRELGRLDIVINNAGVMLLGPIVDAPVEEWDRMIALNVKGLLYVAHAALPHLLERRGGEPAPRRRPRQRQLGRRAAASGVGGGVYQLTKHGVGVFSEALRQEVTAAPRARRRWSSRARPRPSSSPTCARRSATSSARPASRRDPPGRGHRRRDRLHRHAPAPHGDQRDADPPDRAGPLGHAVDREHAVGVARVLGDVAPEPRGRVEGAARVASSGNSTSAVTRPSRSPS